jgi:hypothetical protein
VSTDLNRLLAEAVAKAARELVSQADFEAGWKDVVVSDKAGMQHTVRLTIVMRGLRSEILRKYAATSDPRVVIRPFVATEFGRTEFLDSLITPSVWELANVACCLLLGADAAQRVLQGKPISI